MRQRAAEYDAGQHALKRLEHMRAVIDGLRKSEDHDLNAIVIDLVAGDFRYRTNRECRGGEKKICHLTAGEHGELYQSFLEWARVEIDYRIGVARARMENA